MKGILADSNVQGHLEILLDYWQSAEWREIWESLTLVVHTFADLGLARDTSDDVLWRTCQERQVLLLTANRNDDGPESLESTIRNQGTESSLPVITLADARRLQKDRAYARIVAEKTLDLLFRIDQVRGTGRLYVP